MASQSVQNIVSATQSLLAAVYTISSAYGISWEICSRNPVVYGHLIYWDANIVNKMWQKPAFIGEDYGRINQAHIYQDMIQIHNPDNREWLEPEYVIWFWRQPGFGSFWGAVSYMTGLIP